MFFYEHSFVESQSIEEFRHLHLEILKRLVARLARPFLGVSGFPSCLCDRATHRQILEKRQLPRRRTLVFRICPFASCHFRFLSKLPSGAPKIVSSYCFGLGSHVTMHMKSDGTVSSRRGASEQ